MPTGPDIEEMPPKAALFPGRARGPVGVSRGEAPRGPIEANQRRDILAVYQVWCSGNRINTAESWHHFLKDWNIYDQRSLGLMYGKLYDTLSFVEHFNDFLIFLKSNEPVLPRNEHRSPILHSALPPPHFATICSLLESLHSRVSALERLG